MRGPDDPSAAQVPAIALLRPLAVTGAKAAIAAIRARAQPRCVILMDARRAGFVAWLFEPFCDTAAAAQGRT
jgi:hypothetical protein